MSSDDVVRQEFVVWNAYGASRRELADTEASLTRYRHMAHMLYRQMQAAYAAGLRDGPDAVMEWLFGALVGPGALPQDGASPEWYAEDAWTEGPPWQAIPESNATVSEPFNA